MNGLPTREPSPVDIMDLRAQAETSRQTRYDAERRRLMKEIDANLTAVQTAESASQPKGVYRPTINEGMDHRLLPLHSRYPIINEIYLRQIMENKFDPINISKLRTDVTAVKDVIDDDKITLADIKGFPHMVRCLNVYWQIRLHFAPPPLFKDLGQAFSIYLDRLLYLYTLNTWESVKEFHICFHKMRIYEGIDNPIGWKSIDGTLEQTNLQKRESKLHKKIPKDKSTSPQGENDRGKVYYCRRFNSGLDCYPGCKYQHICSNCGKNHPAMNCFTSTNPARETYFNTNSYIALHSR